MIINVCKYISTGYSRDEADILSPIIKRAILSTEPFVIDFANVKYYTTTFFNIITCYIGQLGYEEYCRRIHICNLTESGMEVYKIALNYAIDYYKNLSVQYEGVSGCDDK